MNAMVGIGALQLHLRERGQPLLGGEAAARAGRVNGMDVAVPSAVFLPTGGMGFFGWPAIAGHRGGRDFIIEFSGWKAEGGRLKARDEVAGLAIEIAIADPIAGITAVSTAITNTGNTEYALDRCMAASMVAGPGEVELQSFTGMWGREFHLRRETLGTGLWLQESRRGRTSHDRFPAVSLRGAHGALHMHLGWSGSHAIAIDRLDDGRRLVHVGELFEPGETILAPGETYRSPTAYIGFDDASFHRFVRSVLLKWPGGAMRPRPVTLNTWEGNYFDHKVDALKAQATAAAELGIERFVLDDGWFGRRDSDTTSLGDWHIDARKYPQGLKPLADHVTALGMEFGIWFEPEMVSPDSDLMRAHPDWALQVEGRPLLLSRHQLVLDLSRAEVSAYLFDCMDKVLKAHRISCVKWDMNRDLTHAGGRDGRAAASKQTRAVYALMDRLRAAHPQVEIESCASGGGRADYGALARSHRVWTSDCTDALERLEIQRGARVFLPPEILGAHVSASPNHQTHRRHTLGFRAMVALAYHFGVELNPLTLAPEERGELRDWIALHKRLRPLLHGPEGQFHLEPLDGRYVWGAASSGRIAAVVAQGAMMMSEQPPPLALPADGGTWRIAAIHPRKPDFIRISPAQQDMLDGKLPVMPQALPLPMLHPESAVVLELEIVEGA